LARLPAGPEPEQGSTNDRPGESAALRLPAVARHGASDTAKFRACHRAQAEVAWVTMWPRGRGAEPPTRTKFPLCPSPGPRPPAAPASIMIIVSRRRGLQVQAAGAADDLQVRASAAKANLILLPVTRTPPAPAEGCRYHPSMSRSGPTCQCHGTVGPSPPDGRPAGSGSARLSAPAQVRVASESDSEPRRRRGGAAGWRRSLS
jgi:hypothetical protein